MNTPRTPTGIIPYITAREGEAGGPASMLGTLPKGKGLYYLDEGPRDRDHRGVLWARCSQSLADGRPTGAPRFREVHPSRQRETMMSLRCQVCVVRPASRTDLGHLFLETRPAPGEVEPGWPEGARTAQPPLCLEHAAAAAEHCPHLAKAGHVALRVKRPRLHGVIETPYRFSRSRGLEAVTDQDETLLYGDPLAGWFLASQSVRRLCDVTIVGLDTELATAGRPR